MTETPGIDRRRLHGAYRGGLDVGALLRACYRRLEAVNDPGIFIHLAPLEATLARAAALPAFDPERLPLWGLPFAVKDNIDVAGMPTTAGCPAYAYLPEADAPVVARLTAAGAICLGKTNLDQFATGLVGVRTPYPAPRNAIDPLIVPGGSSSGSAVAVAHGIVSFALGTDTAGSGRVPAALNNIVGLKPSLGALSTQGVVPACRTLDCVSVFALTVDDAWAAFAAAQALDPADPWSRDRPAAGYGAMRPGLVVGVPTAKSRKFFGDAAHARMFDRAIADLEALGAKLQPVDLEPFFEVAALLYEGAWVAERHAAIEGFLATRAEALHPTTRSIIQGAERLSATDAFKGFYRLSALRREIEPVLEGVDLLVVPTIPNFVTLDEIAADPIGPNSRLGTYTNFVNLLDMAAIAVPTGARDDGRPGSVTLLARGGADGLIASVARALHGTAAPLLGATGLQLETPPPPPDAAAAHEIELVVVGAHMSGMPLNGELVALGGRHLRTGSTLPCYRLWALPGGQPQRPGLTRVNDDETDGSAIEVEVWALPEAGFARLVASIPSPLGIGTVRLDDGTAPKGYLAEAAGTMGATDVSAFGGWRRYCAVQQ